jgi:hypothetical protein
MLFVGLTATIVMSFAVSSASARRFALNTQRWTAIWNPLNLTAAGVVLRCPVTLEGSFHSATLSKVSGQLIGYVTVARVAEAACTNGSARALSETLPWHVQYNSFAGSLPNITEIRIALIGARFRTIISNNECLTETTQREPAFGRIKVTGASEEEIRKTNQMEAEEGASIVLRGNFICNLAGSGRFSGTAELFQLGTTTRILVRLVQ